MCGIFATTQSAEWRSKVDDVLTALGNRGPDQIGVAELSNDVLLAQTRLEIIGLGDLGRQPATSEDGTVCLTYNGEIYNYRALASSRSILDARSDTRVLVELLAERRIEALSHLRGMYAFVAWDETKARLIAARDPFGIKPLYVLNHPRGGVTLCSELGPLLLHPDARKISPTSLTQYLATGHTGPIVTLYQNVSKLLPGRVYTWQLESESNWALRVEDLEPPSESDLTSPIDALQDSVLAHLVSDVEVGAFLSAGVDSTLLCAIARPFLDRLRTFTVAFPEYSHLDESDLAEHNARLLGTTHETLKVTTEGLVRAVPTVIREHGEPLADGAALAICLLAQLASSRVKVVLTGEGADELFGGYARYRIVRLLPRLRHTLRPLTMPLAPHWGIRRGTKPWARALEAALWGQGLRSYQALLSGEFSPLERLVPTETAAVLDSLGSHWNQGWSDVAAARAYDLSVWLPNVYLEKMDRATMAHSLEARVPYLDRVVASVARKTKLDEGKQSLRHALIERLPSVQLPDRKRGLDVNARALVAAMQPQLKFAFQSRESLLMRWLGQARTAALNARCDRSPDLAYRVAAFAVWQQEFSHLTFECESHDSR